MVAAAPIADPSNPSFAATNAITSTDVNNNDVALFGGDKGIPAYIVDLGDSDDSTSEGKNGSSSNVTKASAESEDAVTDDKSI